MIIQNYFLKIMIYNHIKNIILNKKKLIKIYFTNNQNI